MKLHYNQNYTKDEVSLILDRIKGCVRNKKYIIAMNENRQENIDFINEYNIRSDKQRKILLHLKIEDFCYSLQNEHKGYEHEILYVFVPQMKLFNINGEKEIVDIYVKINIIDFHGESEAIIISFHKRNKPANYLFR